MNDRELIELAAKAAGLSVLTRTQAERDAFIGRENASLWIRDKSTEWNPLTDDGDALRLLAALPSLWTLALKFGPHVHLSVAWGTGAGIVKIQSVEAGDMAAAIRRAIVRAAAAIAAGTEPLPTADGPSPSPWHTLAT